MAARRLVVRYGLEFPVTTEQLERVIVEVGAKLSFDRSMIESGALVEDGSELVVLVKPTDSWQRQKFTIAHEIGHLVGRVFQLRLPPNEERWCDAFASELLLPGQWIERRYSRAPQSVNAVSALSKTAGVSMPAALIALHHSASWDAALLTFRQSGGSWRLWSTQNLPQSLRGLSVDKESLRVLDTGSKQARRLRLRMRSTRGVIEMDVEAIGTGQVRWVLIPSHAIHRSRGSSG